ncbi:MAG: hypothetical protein IT364_25230 [Candidatus Hydrogenedentes bacterium]|nr:hypothetical protein [Candidatus Hydrogenedentota bacterium]
MKFANWPRRSIPPALGLLALCLAALAPAAHAQAVSAIPEGEIFADISMTFVTAYKDGAWVPVDVTVRNNKEDIQGWIEVSVTTLNGPASPVYRTPAESPKGSTKRFRVYCRLSGATSIQAMLYKKRRPALDAPVRVDLTPIRPEDLVSLILDDEPADYGFLRSALDRAGGGAGLHRHALRTAEVPQMPAYPQCFTAYNVVVLGQVDPGQIGLRQRDLLLRYVEEGGVLVVFAGENAARFRGTWVEELGGVSIGEQQTIDEAVLANSVFQEADRAGARSGREALITRLTPAADGVLVWGKDPVLAASRPLARGVVVTLAVDAHGKALQECAGFLHLWGDLVSRNTQKTQLNFAQAASTASQMLPSATGIRVYPWTSVLIYLLLYFFVGVVGNWLFWNWMKRREMAWVCLVFFSLGFTAYALVYGTAGRAKSTELTQLEVLRVPESGRVGSVHSMVGVLSARTAWYDLRLTNEFALVSDSWNATSQQYYMGPGGFMDANKAFQFVFDQPPRVEELRVGASVLRVFEVESDATLPGGIEGALVWDDEGLHGNLVNKTGVKIRSPFVLLEGMSIPLGDMNDATEWPVSIPRTRIVVSTMNRRTEFGPYGYYGSYGMDRTDLTVVESGVQQSLITTANDFTGQINPALGPFLCGWAEGVVQRTVSLDEPATERIARTFVVADIRVDRAKAPVPLRVPLQVLVNEVPQQTNPYAYGWGNSMQGIQGDQKASVQIIVPPQYADAKDTTLQVELHWTADNPETAMVYAPEGTDADWSATHQTGTQPQSNRNNRNESYAVTTYQERDWQRFYDATKTWVRGNVQLKKNATNGGYWGSYHVNAALLVPRHDEETGDWTPWQ